MKAKIRKFQESKSAQIFHLGPYSEEGSRIQKFHDFIKQEGGSFDGLKQKHYEIYLSDPRRTSPEKLKTVIRRPFR
ncbi:MAG: GyrI-like domain-containing protein [Candidatus Odinarchaeota archaeon]